MLKFTWISSSQLNEGNDKISLSMIVIQYLSQIFFSSQYLLNELRLVLSFNQYFALFQISFCLSHRLFFSLLFWKKEILQHVASLGVIPCPSLQGKVLQEKQEN